MDTSTTNSSVNTNNVPYTPGSNQPMTTYSPDSGYTTTTPSAIPVDSLNTTITPPTIPSPASSPDYQSLISSSVPPPPAPTPDNPTPATDTSTSLLGKISSLMGLDSGKAAYTQAQNDASGATALTARQNVLQSQIQALNDTAQGIPTQVAKDYTGTGATTGGIAPISHAALADNALQALSLKSEYDLNAGDLVNAQNTAQKAIDMVYQPIEDAITNNTKLLQLYQPFMTAEQKTQSDAIVASNQAKATALATSKQQQQDVVNAAQSAGDSASAAAALKLDPNSPTFSNDLGNIQAGIKTGTTATGDKILGNATVGYFTFDPTTGKTTPIGNPTTGTTGGGSSSSTTSSGGSVGGLTSDSQNFWAQAASSGVNTNSLLPSLGMGSAAVATKTALLNKIASNAQTLGIDGATFGAILTDSRAKQAAYTKLQAVGSQTQVNEANANKDFSQLIGLSQKLDANTLNTAVPLLNSWIRTGQLATTGNPDVDNFLAVLTTSLTEYAKVVSGATGGSGVTDSANSATQKLLSSGLNTKTIQSFANTAKQEMNNRTSSYDQALQGLFGNIEQAQSTTNNGGLGGSSTSASSSLPQNIQTAISSNLSFSSDGKTAYIPNSVWQTFGTNKDAVLQEAKNDGFTLLIK